MSNPLQLIVTCLVDAFYPEIGIATVKVLEKRGFDVEFPAAQTCCGQIAFNSGLNDDARVMARHTLDVLAKTEGPIVLPSGSCTDMIAHHYHDLFADDPVYGPMWEALAPRVFELTQFLVDELQVTELGASCESCQATYHPSCHGLRNLGLRTQATKLLHEVKGLTLLDLPEADVCCGFGGTFAVKMSDISGVMLNRKLDHIIETGAEILVGGDASCLMHMAGGLQKRGSMMQVKHIVELLAEGQ